MTDESVREVAFQSKKCQINYKLLPLKGFYFTFYAGFGTLVPFIALFLHSCGLTKREVGIIHGVMPFVGILLNPAVGAVADRWHVHKQAIMVCTFLTGVCFFSMLFLPARPRTSLTVTSQLHCNASTSFFRDCRLPRLASKPVNYHTCEVTWSEFADSHHNSTYKKDQNVSDLECEASCWKMPSFQDVALCFADGPGHFVGHCGGEECILHSSVVFRLLDVQHIINGEKAAAVGNQKNEFCRDFDLTMLEFKGEQRWQLLCDKSATLACSTSCRNPPPELCQFHVKEFDAIYGLVFFIYLLANMTFTPIMGLADAAAFSLLGDEPFKYGKQRQWGTVGFAVFAIASTFSMDRLAAKGQHINFSATFYIFAALYCIATAVAYFLDLSSGHGRRAPRFRDFLALMTDLQVLVFLFVVIYFGMSIGVVQTFLFWYLQDLGATPLVFGFDLVVNSLAEAPMLFISGDIIRRVGAVPCIYIALVALSVRMLGYSLLVNPWVVLVIAPLHGLTFGLLWAAASTHANMIAPPGLSATMQGLLYGMHFAVGKGLGSLATGFLFDHVGERFTFQVYSMSTAGLLVVYLFLNVFVFKSHKIRSKSVRRPSKEQPYSVDKQSDHLEEPERDGTSAEDGRQDPST
ncbi:hypothetical protein BaRGS_00025815 [Batillaria attramentaria]|uniref:Major facilitator superfamily (MFS) profile domain-containing protein n=1 Tax=Batillaria attramentaria TaxID=370345 RepID=A0ABD0K684_9CAEN